MHAEFDISNEYEKRLKEWSSNPKVPEKAELISALHKVLPLIASNPAYWYEEAMIRGLLWRCRKRKPE